MCADGGAPTNEVIPVDVVGPQGQAVAEGRFKLSEQPRIVSNTEPLVSVELDLGNQSFSSMGNDYYEALQQLRRELNLHSLDVNCYGSCLEFAPTVTGRSERRGRVACRLALGQPINEADAVDIFARPDAAFRIATPEEQQQFLSDWRRSLVRVFKVLRVQIEILGTEHAVELIIADFLKRCIVRRTYQFDALVAEERPRVNASLAAWIMRRVHPDWVDQLGTGQLQGESEGERWHFHIIDGKRHHLRTLLNPGGDQPDTADVLRTLVNFARHSAGRLWLSSLLPHRSRRLDA